MLQCNNPNTGVYWPSLEYVDGNRWFNIHGRQVRNACRVPVTMLLQSLISFLLGQVWAKFSNSHNLFISTVSIVSLPHGIICNEDNKLTRENICKHFHVIKSKIGDISWLGIMTDMMFAQNCGYTLRVRSRLSNSSNIFRCKATRLAIISSSSVVSARWSRSLNKLSYLGGRSPTVTR